MELRILARRKAASLFAPFPLLLSFETSVRLWGKRSRCDDSSSRQWWQSQPNVFAVTVVVVPLDRSLYFHLLPSRLLACQRSFKSYGPATESMNRNLLAAFPVQY